jgi:hypothetical protein
MSDFLENLKRGMQEAQQKFAAAQQKFTATNAEFQAAQQRLATHQAEYQAALQEFQAFQTLVNSQTRKEQLATGTPPAPAAAVAAAATAAAAVTRTASHSADAVLVRANGAVSQNVVASQSDDNKSDGNKTQAVRVLLRQHPAGMTPGEIWKCLESQMSNRVYLYSILKRLKDRGDVRERRGKYYCNLKLEDNQGQATVQ